ncbi:hypothetical protein [Sutcliffiella rhizosphaerae]|uniref:Uncharacterized protein n=1 Tax=Sutcliffiella rhizosphaerae TaxID=2880967 RepID=A0ABM8YS24_9BACI|nr:hypothetical protein [Sutcliffiella rhizosphaerae]CAG9622610.1 hypothetical protein BACCIP111883_03401 [Sutcliffiella rhizosphaerae]
MANVVSKNEIADLFNEMMHQMDMLEETMSNSLKIEREEMEGVMKDQINRLHVTLDEVEKVMNEQQMIKISSAKAVDFRANAYPAL